MYYLIIILTAISNYKGGTSIEIKQFNNLHECNIVGKASEDLIKTTTNKRVSYKCVKTK